MTDTDTTVASGIFKFSNKVNSQTIAAFVASEWRKDPNFLEISLRGCDGDKKVGIAFKYRHNCSTAHEFERLADQWRGLLLRVFHEDFLGWDISSWTQVIK